MVDVNTQEDIIFFIKEYYAENNIVPTIASFCKKYDLHASSLVRNFGSWNSLLAKSGLKPNKINKRTNEQLLLWLKSHPSATYINIPNGIRHSLNIRFGSISNARKNAGLQITDWRSFVKKKAYKNKNAGRPIEYSKDMIITGLRDLAIKIGKPPRMKDIKRKSCGFPLSAIFSRFKTFNEALQQAQLPPAYSYHEFNKLENELEILMMNIKIEINDIPKLYNIEINNYNPKFVYDDRWEDIKLTRNDAASSVNNILSYKDKCNNIIVYYLVDDSLYENENFKMICVMDYINIIKNEILINKIKSLRIKYDEVNRKYIGQPIEGMLNV